MYSTKSLQDKLKLFYLIFLPVLIYQFANFSATFIDTVMTGQYNTIHLAGVAIAGSLWNPFFTLLNGIIVGLVPIVGQYLGKQEKHNISAELHQFIYISFGLSAILFVLGAIAINPILDLLHLEPTVRTVAFDYLVCLSIGILPLFLFSVLRSFLDALGLTRLSMYLMLLILPINAFFNYLLIYGEYGWPEMGGAGAGLGTALSYWLLLIIALIVVTFHSKTRTYSFWKFNAFDKTRCLNAIKLGLPIGGSIFAEVAVFAGIGLFMAKFSSEIIAAHQAAMNFAMMVFAFPLSVSIAMTIVISFEVGAKRPEDIKQYTFIGILTALGFAAFTLTFLYIFRDKVAGLYGDSIEFIKLTSSFLAFSLLFQLSDALAAPIQGILRGYKDTTSPFIIGLIGYWIIGLPCAITIDYFSKLGPYSYWIGLIIGLFCCCVMLIFRLIKVSTRFKNKVEHKKYN